MIAEEMVNRVLSDTSDLIGEAVMGMRLESGAPGTTVVHGGWPFQVVGRARKEEGRRGGGEEGMRGERPVEVWGTTVVVRDADYLDGRVPVPGEIEVAGGEFIMTVGGEELVDGEVVGRGVAVRGPGVLCWKFVLTATLVPISEDLNEVEVSVDPVVELLGFETMPVTVLPTVTVGQWNSRLELAVGEAGGVVYQLCAVHHGGGRVTVYQRRPSLKWQAGLNGPFNAPLVRFVG